MSLLLVMLFSSQLFAGRKEDLQTLGLSGNPTQQEIKKAYKKMTLKWHPDKNHEAGATEKMKVINAANSRLNGKRKYDNEETSNDKFGGMSFEDIRNSFEKTNPNPNNNATNKQQNHNRNNPLPIEFYIIIERGLKLAGIVAATASFVLLTRYKRKMQRKRLRDVRIIRSLDLTDVELENLIQQRYGFFQTYLPNKIKWCLRMKRDWRTMG